MKKNSIKTITTLILVSLFSCVFSQNQTNHSHSDNHNNNKEQKTLNEKIALEQFGYDKFMKDFIVKSLEKGYDFQSDECLKNVFIGNHSNLLNDIFNIYIENNSKKDIQILYDKHMSEFLNYLEIFKRNENKLRIEYDRRVKSSHNSFLKFNNPFPLPQSSCINMDFETGDLTGWTTTSSGGGASYATTVGQDPNVNAINTVFSGNNSACIDGLVSTGNLDWVQIEQSFQVTNTNKDFIFYTAVIIDRPGHTPCSDNAKFEVSVKDANGSVIPCSNVVLLGANAQGNACSVFNGFQTFGNFDYLNWTPIIVPLGSYVGQIVTIRFRVTRCNGGGGHGARAYIEASCNPTPLQATGNLICPGKSVYVNAPNVPGYIYNWAGPSGFSANTYSINPNLSGVYTVTMAVASNPTCKMVLDTVLTSVPSPTASFNYTLTPCTTTFSVPVASNSSSANNDPIAGYTWVWNDATANGSGSSNSHTYLSSGTKTIELKITSQSGCRDSVRQSFTINTKPVVDFNTQNNCLTFSSTFTSVSTPSSAIAAQVWTFGDASPNGMGTQVNHTYLNPGTYNVKLVATSVDLCKDSITKPITILPKPSLAFSPNAVCLGSATNFNNTSTIAAPSSISNWAWDIDNNGSIDNTTQSPSLTFTAIGSFSVELKATSNQGCSDSIVRVVSVFGVPSASFTSNTVCFGSPTQLTDASNGNGSNVNIYQWDFSNNGSVDITGFPNPNYTFPNVGVNLVSYTVATTPTLGLVCSNSTNTITVFVNPQPTANFTHINKCINDQPINFDASSSTLNSGTITSYAWAYGNGANNTGVATNYSYLSPGTYSVTLLVTSDNGCQSTIIKPVIVFPKPIMAIVNSPACDGRPVIFNANSQSNSGNVTSWNWDFNNSITSFEAQGQSTSYTFPSAGNHTVALVSITDNGCRDTISMPFYVDYVPVPQFSVNRPSGCPEHCVVFSDLTPQITGPGQNAEWKWYLGDGTVVTSNNNGTQSHCYTNNSSTQSALFDVKLVVTTDRGCKDSLTKISYITVYPVPIAAYNASPNPANIIEPLVHFNNLSSDYIKWWWSFGDGPEIDSTNVSPYHEYSDINANTYNTYLIVQNQYGCRDTAYLKVEITPEFSFYIPNAFTPHNGDGINDYFSGIGIGIEKYEMWIFDRWGEMIYYTDDINKGWNGKVQGKTQECKQDVYVWKVKLKDVLGKKHDYVGHVTLLR